MALPADFSKIYGSAATGGLTPISDVNYAKGWEFVGANPPTKNDFSYLQNLSDQKSQWLYLNKLQRTDPFGDIKSDGAAAVSKAISNLGLGEAAKSSILQSEGVSVKDVMSQNAITYLLSLKAGVNGERVEAGNFREALNLGNAALKNTGTGQGQLPDMSFFSASLLAAGWQKLPSGLIIQWGQTLSNSNGFAPWTYPIAFPNACFQVYATPFVGASVNNFTITEMGSPGLTAVTAACYVNGVQSSIAGQVGVRYMAIGY